MLLWSLFISIGPAGCCLTYSTLERHAPTLPYSGEENMASEKMKRVSTLMSCLSMDILEQLGMKLNPRHPMKDFRFLAGKMNYNYESVRNFERQKNPTVSLLYEWWMSSERNGEVKTVTHLIELLKSMGRDDAVNILRPVEFTGRSNQIA